MAVPRDIGGSEVDFPTYVQVIEELGKADASTGWAVNQGATFGTFAARMAPDVAREIWIDTPRSVCCEHPGADARRRSWSRAATASRATSLSAPVAGTRPG